MAAAGHQQSMYYGWDKRVIIVHVFILLHYLTATGW